ncbi:MAG: transcription-repair coupling factor, partial [Chloroflexi bacterium]|nr:transcription-repair coupling factor [Chloroflexota bacterium]
QRSLEVVKTINIGLAGELAAPLLNRKEIEKTLEIFSGFTPEGELRHQVAEEISKLKQGQAPDNGQFYAPLFNNGSLFDYLPKGGLLVLDEVESLKEQHAFIIEEAAALREDKLKCGELPSGYPVPYYQWRQIEKTFSSLNRLEFTSWGGGGEQPHRLTFSVAPSYNGRLPVLLGEIKELIKRRHRFVFTSYQADRLVELLKEGGLSASPSLMLVKGSLKQGWVLDNNVHLLTDNELFGFVKQLRTVKKRPAPRHDLMREIKAGDFVVHIDHGIARYAGITTMTSGSIEKEYLVLEYAATDRLYVPADQIDRISRYVGAGEKPPIPSRLGTEEWGHLRKQAEEAAEEAAAELLELYASRQMADGYAYSADTVWQQELEGSFPYIETPDQQTALAAVKEDMEKARPMDRLILGDVGYGKTEVALRATFKAVMDGR